MKHQFKILQGTFTFFFMNTLYDIHTRRMCTTYTTIHREITITNIELAGVRSPLRDDTFYTAWWLSDNKRRVTQKYRNNEI